MSETNINILLENVTREQQIEVEDICFRDGLTITQYFIGLHNDAQLRKEAIKYNSGTCSNCMTRDDLGVEDIINVPTPPHKTVVTSKNNSFIKDEKLFPPSKLAETISKSKKKRGKR